MPKQTASVDQFLQTLTHPMKTEIERVRSIILESDPTITENITWNAPSFCFEGEDRVTFKLFPYDSVQLIFHRGAKVKDTKDFTFTDESGLLKWITADRAILTLQNAGDIEAKAEVLTTLVHSWMEATREV